jgi:hypothetical protein
MRQVGNYTEESSGYFFKLKLSLKECVVIGKDDEEIGIFEPLATCMKRQLAECGPNDRVCQGDRMSLHWLLERQSTNERVRR